MASKNFERMPLYELQKTVEYQRLTEKQRLFVSTYVATGMLGHYDARAAVLAAYPASPESARVMGYSMLANVRIIDVLNLHFGKNATQAFLDQVNRAILNRKVTHAQVEAMILKSEILGVGSSLSKQNRSRLLARKRYERKKKARKAKRDAARKANEAAVTPPASTKPAYW